jgi:hypothetical protein
MTNKELNLEPGVIFGDAVKSLFDYANRNDFAIPAVNVVGTNSVNAVMETAKALGQLPVAFPEPFMFITSLIIMVFR